MISIKMMYCMKVCADYEQLFLDMTHLKSWCLLSNIFTIFINVSIFVREYRTRRSGTPHLNERYVTKPQISNNNMQKTRPPLERFY